MADQLASSDLLDELRKSKNILAKFRVEIVEFLQQAAKEIKSALPAELSDLLESMDTPLQAAIKSKLESDLQKWLSDSMNELDDIIRKYKEIK